MFYKFKITYKDGWTKGKTHYAYADSISNLLTKIPINDKNITDIKRYKEDIHDSTVYGLLVKESIQNKASLI